MAAKQAYREADDFDSLLELDEYGVSYKEGK
jgi:hypothetical protein